MLHGFSGRIVSSDDVTSLEEGEARTEEIFFFAAAASAAAAAAAKPSSERWTKFVALVGIVAVQKVKKKY